MNLDLHIVQSFAPSNLNRDDTGAPKDCDFGGVRRARISSQSLKRAMRRAFAEQSLVPAELRATRTKRVVDQVAGAIVARGRPEEEAARLAAAVIEAGGIKVTDGEVGALLFVGADEVARLAGIAVDHADELAAATTPAESGTGKRRAAAAPAGLKKAVIDALSSPRAVDIALFGRFVAELPEGTVDAAAQVAHAISTHRVDLDFDYFTAMDDLATAAETGAAMVDTVEFNAATYYRYATLDIGALEDRLGDPAVTALALDAFVRAAITAEPTGKQNSFAAHNPPSYVLAVVRDHGAWSLANAFLDPVRPGAGHDLVDRSVEALECYWVRLGRMYGTRDIRATASLAERDLDPVDGIDRVADLDALVARVASAAVNQ